MKHVMDFNQPDPLVPISRRAFISPAGSVSLATAMTTNAQSPAELCFKDAVELARLIRTKEISAVEVMTAFLAQIKRVNPKVNAIPTFIDEEAALRAAQEADDRLAKGQMPPALHGFPHAVKDLVATAGIRTTQGSPIYKDFVPTSDELLVQRLKAAGAIIIGKTNTPEFGAGSHTFNPVFGATRNPYDLSKSCGGSSGGAAVALACGMLPLADGSDLGGSLRNPASFCNVVGFRTSPGRVPVYPSAMAWNTLAVQGPMARTVQDVAYLLAVIAGPDARVPIALNDPGTVFNRSLQRDFTGVRIAWSRNLGRYPVQSVVTEVCDKARHIEVFTRRATLLGKPLGSSTVSGQQSLKTLLDEPDFALATFLLSVLGEGTFLNLLWFLEQHAPDPVTQQIARLVVQDEARHVAFGVSHLQYQIASDPSLRERLAMAINRRHDALAQTAGLNEEVFDALILLAAGSWQPEQIAAGFAKVQALKAEMHAGRKARLAKLGFSKIEADDLSALHTRNFM